MSTVMKKLSMDSLYYGRVVTYIVVILGILIGLSQLVKGIHALNFENSHSISVSGVVNKSSCKKHTGTSRFTCCTSVHYQNPVDKTLMQADVVTSDTDPYKEGSPIDLLLNPNDLSDAVGANIGKTTKLHAWFHIIGGVTLIIALSCMAYLNYHMAFWSTANGFSLGRNL